MKFSEMPYKRIDLEATKKALEKLNVLMFKRMGETICLRG